MIKISEFTVKSWNINGLNYLLKKLRDTGKTTRQPGSKTMSACIMLILGMTWFVLSQKVAPKTHQTTCQTARRLAFATCDLVYRIIRQDFQLKCHKKRHVQELTMANCAH